MSFEIPTDTKKMNMNMNSNINTNTNTNPTSSRTGTRTGKGKGTTTRIHHEGMHTPYPTFNNIRKSDMSTVVAKPLLVTAGEVVHTDNNASESTVSYQQQKDSNECKKER
ncbi:hypothetical protein CANARDRAFT_29943 [[Candida] arabinofermentans NRRL YB-2248]|uniref:Uncharacterized protein n=1 Tax=[Candida] arabinofermentans NRRL YB-2248 TaxID=983967 RepID=A0A1E4SVG0_9ASCO|nr:hypothetical protein CANARDRAFT_29943 [[Candida] arabinofermentans NRRL YB-2248]